MREKRPGVWELRVFVGRDDSGRVRHRSVTFHGTKRPASRELARLVAEQERPLAALPVPVATSPSTRPWTCQTTINDAIEGWKRNGWQDLSPNTVRGYEGVWARHVRSSIGTRRITELTPYEVEQYFRALKEAGAGQTTVRLVRALLHRSCRLARKWSGNTLPNPITDTELPTWSGAERPRPVRAPEPGEVLALLGAAAGEDPRVATFVRLVAATGMRRGEACALRWDDIDLDNAVVRIDEGVVSSGGSSSAREPKTAASARRLAVDADTLRALVDLRHDQERLATSCDASLDDQAFVFSFEPGGRRPPNPDWMSHSFASVRQRAGVAADVHLHSLRHFHATVVDAVISEAQKQARLGWSTVRMARHYTDAVPAEDRRAADHVREVLAGSSVTPAPTSARTSPPSAPRRLNRPAATAPTPRRAPRPRGAARPPVAESATGR